MISVNDPVAMPDAKAELPKIMYCKDPYLAVRGADAVVIVTEWNQLRNLDLGKIKKAMKGKYFFDLRNIYQPEKLINMGFQYHCVGRVRG
jgi:UDPglucose 6-dehydrogenase